MEKILTVTIKVEKNKPTRIEFLEPESGDSKTYTITDKNEIVMSDLGNEILSWASLMEDELEA